MIFTQSKSKPQIIQVQNIQKAQKTMSSKLKKNLSEVNFQPNAQSVI